MKHFSDAVNPTPESAEPDLKTKSGWRRALNWAVGLVAFGWVAVLVAWSALHIFIVPRIGDYREVMQQQASRALGVRVEIGRISMQGGWWVPWLELGDIQLFDKEGREALRLPRVLAAVSPRSVLFGQFEQLDIEQPELEIRRDVEGHVWVAGLDTGASGDGSGADWFFSQPEFVVRQGVVHWRDDSRSTAAQTSAPVLTLQGVDLSVKNHRFQHELRLDATPPEALGQRVSMRGKFYQAPWQRAGDTAHWSGELYADLPYVDLAALRQWVVMDTTLSDTQTVKGPAFAISSSLNKPVATWSVSKLIRAITESEPMGLCPRKRC